MTSLELDEHPLGAGYLIAASGEIDHSTTPLVANVLRRVTLEHEGPVVLDLTGATFIDSAGISTLLNALRRLTRLKRKMILICPPGPVQRVFELLGLVGTFHIVGTRREAPV